MHTTDQGEEFKNSYILKQVPKRSIGLLKKKTCLDRFPEDQGQSHTSKEGDDVPKSK